MIITKIERQKRLQDRVNIYCDGEFAFGITDEVLLKFGLRKGDNLDPEKLASIRSAGEFSLAKQKALLLLSYRMRSEFELRSRLLEKEFQPGTVRKVVEHLRSQGMIDDLKFSRAFIHDSRLKRASGRRLLQEKLRSKGVPPEVIREVLDESFSAQEEQKMALEAARKHLSRSLISRKKTDAEKQQARIAHYLARRGFSWSVISPVLRKIFRGVQESSEVD